MSKKYAPLYKFFLLDKQKNYTGFLVYSQTFELARIKFESAGYIVFGLRKGEKP